MSFRIDPQDENAVVFSGHEEGIADNPFDGISDMRNINIISIPDEASVNFATSKVSSNSFQNWSVTSATSASPGVITFTPSIPTTGSSALEVGQAVTFSGGSLPSGIVAGTIYWVASRPSNTTMTLFTTYAFGPTLTISGTGTGTFSTVDINQPQNFAKDTNLGKNWVVDKLGQVWSDTQTTSQNSFWTFTGNRVPGTSFTNGNGIGYYQTSNGTGYIFVIHNSSIDYTASASISWVYQWNPNDGTAGGYNTTPTKRLNTGITIRNSHKCLVGQDNVFYYCDASYVGSFFEKVDGPPQTIIFDPSNTATYTFAAQAVGLPKIDIAQCLAELGVPLLIGGQLNAIYPWNRTGTSFNYPILLAESSIQQMVTVNTNTFIFVGNRGRIWITNGSQAQLYKKIPDHISGTVEPYYTWGGACSNKNQLYFSASVTTNAGVANNNYGGVWAIDLDSKAIRLTNKLSYGTYAGYATALATNTAVNPAGTGLFIGWNDGASGYGLDGTVSTPYTGSQASIDYDLLEVGTLLRPKSFKTAEYRLTVPMVSGESVSIYWRKKFNDSYTLLFTTNGTTGNGSISDVNPVNFENAQWIQLQGVLNSTASSPSYTRLREIRLK